MRRYLQFSLRSLSVVLTLAAVACWVLPPAVKRYQEWQERARLQYYLDQAGRFPAANRLIPIDGLV